MQKQLGEEGPSTSSNEMYAVYQGNDMDSCNLASDSIEQEELKVSNAGMACRYDTG
jgi:hypothetical protein